MKKSKFLLLILVFYFACNSFAQQQNIRSRSELGFTFGGMYYIGDLNTHNHFKSTKANLGLIYRYYINPRLEYRAQISYGNIVANDANSKNAFQINRNLSFQSDIFEIATGIEMNYLKYQTGSKDFFITPYIYAELGLFRMNPKTNYNGDLVELQALGTEGQGTELSGKKQYKKVQLCIPMGVV